MSRTFRSRFNHRGDARRTLKMYASLKGYQIEDDDGNLLKIKSDDMKSLRAMEFDWDSCDWKNKEVYRQNPTFFNRGKDFGPFLCSRKKRFFKI